MPRTTFLDAKNSRIPESIGACPGDVRFRDVLNEAQQRLLSKGLWWNTCARLRICATDSCITFPPQVASIEVAAVCGQPLAVRDFWFEYLQSGVGLRQSGSSCMDEALFRGNFCVFSDIRGTGKKLRFICDLVTDIGKTVLALGYDDNGNWIRTLQNGVYADGEVVALSQSPGTNSVNNFSVVTDLQPPSNLDGQWWLWEFKVADSTQRMIGHFQAFETRPSYSRYFFPSISGCGCTGKATPVDVIAKLAFIPVKNDTDYLIIGNLPALKDMCQAINAAENEPDAVKKTALLAAGYTLALAELNSELDTQLGSGRRMGISVMGSSVYGNDPVPVLL